MYKLKRSQNKQVVVVMAVIFVGSIVLFNQGSLTTFSANDTSNIQDIKKLQNDKRHGELDEIFEARQKHLTEACIKEGTVPPVSIEDSSFPGKTIVEPSHRILFCPVQKAGSTFWTRTLKAMSSRGRFNSPYQVSQLQKKNIQLYQNFQKSNSQYFKSWFMKNAVSLLVVRDPYTKLFSAYVDKLYHPNYLFWKVTGQPIRNMMEGKNDSVCGNDISFSDFIKYIIYQSNRNGSHLNTHFTPIHKHCDPCSAKYDYIMKFENFKDDCYHILNQWNTRFSLSISFNNFEKETAENIAETHVRISFSTMKQYAIKCNISAYNFLLRTWRFLQITGHIPKEVSLPFPNDEKVGLITKQQLMDAVKDVLSRETDWSQVKKQRREALVQAYQSVDVVDIMELRKIVKPDCVYFGYNTTPEYLFEKSNYEFNYFDGLHVSNS